MVKVGLQHVVVVCIDRSHIVLHFSSPVDLFQATCKLRLWDFSLLKSSKENAL